MSGSQDNLFSKFEGNYDFGLFRDFEGEVLDEDTNAEIVEWDNFGMGYSRDSDGTFQHRPVGRDYHVRMNGSEGTLRAEKTEEGISVECLEDGFYS